MKMYIAAILFQRNARFTTPFSKRLRAPKLLGRGRRKPRKRVRENIATIALKQLLAVGARVNVYL